MFWINAGVKHSGRIRLKMRWRSNRNKGRIFPVSFKVVHRTSKAYLTARIDYREISMHAYTFHQLRTSHYFGKSDVIMNYNHQSVHCCWKCTTKKVPKIRVKETVHRITIFPPLSPVTLVLEFSGRSRSSILHKNVLKDRVKGTILRSRFFPPLSPKTCVLDASGWSMSSILHKNFKRPGLQNPCSESDFYTHISRHDRRRAHLLINELHLAQNVNHYRFKETVLRSRVFPTLSPDTSVLAASRRSTSSILDKNILKARFE